MFSRPSACCHASSLLQAEAAGIAGAIASAAALMSVPSPVACGSSHSSVSRRQPEPVPTSRMRSGLRHPALLARDLERRSDQRFAVGARIERRGRDGEGPAVEIPLAQDARHRLARGAGARHSRAERCELSRGQAAARAPASRSALETPSAPASEPAHVAARLLDAGARKLRCQLPQRPTRRYGRRRAWPASGSGIFAHRRKLAGLIVGGQRIDQLVERGALAELHRACAGSGRCGGR